MKIIFSSNISWSIYNFRLALLKSLQNDGHNIYTVASRDKYSKLLENEGFTYKEIILNNNSTNPIKDFKIIRDYYKLYKEIDPDIICHNAIKPNIYGTIAAGFLGIPVVNNISGLGTLFIKKSISTKIAKLLYKISQIKASKVFFQNSDDLNLFIKNKLIDAEKCKVIPGSGVDTFKFSPPEQTIKNDTFHFLFVGRLLYDKGILEYINAINILKKSYPNVTFEVLGPLYENNTTSVKKETLDFWVSEDIINYLGETDNVQCFMEKTDCIVLPSYREGLSKVLIEASSMGLPIVTTNVAGCKDVVIDEETGFLCNAKDSKDLALKMEKMILLSSTERETMGRKARQRAIDCFDQKIIINIYKKTIDSIFIY
jgi:glycosyltransferase involved in cell wall biosynthesis